MIVKINVISNFLKNPSKIVSNYYTFIPALALVQDQTLLKDILNLELFINKTTFVQKASSQDLAGLIKAYFSMYHMNLDQKQDFLLLGIILNVLK